MMLRYFAVLIFKKVCIYLSTRINRFQNISEDKISVLISQLMFKFIESPLQKGPINLTFNDGLSSRPSLQRYSSVD